FARTVIYMVMHSPKGAMGIVVNKPLPSLTFASLLEQLNIDVSNLREQLIVHAGGPVETGRGFVLHSADYVRDGTMLIGEGMALTATVDVLRAIAEGAGPRQRLLALGHAGWAPGQLEQEIQGNAWLNVDPDDLLVFGEDEDTKWPRAMAKLGIDLSHFSPEAGHA
ncbi:MAG: YqgE/AlgH family protein, partial [Alphaproteobacteria bacterium]|nr:YqgE/AlgH family protein [Alphaproteobacteria bacterium]